MESKYTFLLPAYKRRFLKESLGSIIGQTHKDFRVIVSDDDSPENPKKIVDELNDNRIEYRKNETNIGARNLVAHWNKLLQNCRSEFVIVASDDDVYDIHFLEAINDMVNKHPAVNIFRTGCSIIDTEGKVIRNEKEIDGLLSLEDFIHKMPESNLCIGNYAFRRDSLASIGGFIDFPFGWKSDSATQIALCREHGIACSKEVLFFFRSSGINISALNRGNKESNLGKIEATLAFDKWFTNNMDEVTINQFQTVFRNRLEGELRSYYHALSLPEFYKLFIKLNSEGWFMTTRNKMSFALHRLLHWD